MGAGLTARLPGDQDLEKVLEQQSPKASTGLLCVELGLSTDPAVEGAPGAGPHAGCGWGWGGRTRRSRGYRTHTPPGWPSLSRRLSLCKTELA